MVTALGRVPGYMGGSLSYRQLTSDPNADTRTYTAWTSFSGMFNGHTDNDQWDERQASYISIETMTVIAPSTVVLVQGDEVRDATNKIWFVQSVDSSGPGIVHYTVSSANPAISSGGNRGAGI